MSLHSSPSSPFCAAIEGAHFTIVIFFSGYWHPYLRTTLCTTHWHCTGKIDPAPRRFEGQVRPAKRGAAPRTVDADGAVGRGRSRPCDGLPRRRGPPRPTAEGGVRDGRGRGQGASAADDAAAEAASTADEAEGASTSDEAVAEGASTPNDAVAMAAPAADEVTAEDASTSEEVVTKVT